MDELLYDGRFVRLLKRNDWEFAERPNIEGIVLVIPITDDDCLIFNEQFRIPVGKPVIELPAGLVGDQPGEQGEGLIAGAHRELLEETGYQATTMTFLTEGPPSAGITNEILTVFIARGCHKVAEGGGVDDEAIIVHKVPVADAPDWLKQQAASGKLIDPKVYIGLYAAIC